MEILAALSWDPTVRGALILLTVMAILPGSVFLLLSTNLGARVGLLLALAGFFGWLSMQGVVWTIYARGNTGRAPTWEAAEIVTGDLAESTVEAASGFPSGWEKLEPGHRILGDAQASADKVLAKSVADETAASEEGGGEAKAGGFEPPFKRPEDYVQEAGYRKGGETWFFTLRHRPHYAVIQVRPAIAQETKAGGAPPVPRGDPSKPLTAVIMIRDLGNERFPPFMLAISSLLIFGVIAYVLHRRDKEIMALARLRRDEASARSDEPASDAAG